jgi:transposase
MMAPFHAGGGSLVELGEVVMILELHRQGVSVSAIARQAGLDRKTVHKFIERGLEPPLYGPRPPRASKVAEFARYLRERLAAFPQLTGRRLHRELRELGYTGGYSILTDFLRDIRPTEPAPFEVRFETPPGRQAQVDFAHFRTVFADEPETERIVWLFSLVLGHSRMLWARFVLHQDLPSLLRCHAAAFEALGGVPEHILYDRMRTVFSGEEMPNNLSSQKIALRSAGSARTRRILLFSDAPSASKGGRRYAPCITTYRHVYPWIYWSAADGHEHDEAGPLGQQRRHPAQLRHARGRGTARRRPSRTRRP